MKPIDIIGMGLATPAGNTPDALFEALRAGETCARPIEAFPVDDLPSRLSCTVPEFDAERYLTVHERRRMPRSLQLSIVAALDAVADAGRWWSETEPNPAVVVGTGIGGLTLFEAQAEALRQGGYRRLGPMTVPMIMPNAQAAEIAVRLPTHGPATTLSSACASSAAAIGHACALIGAGRCQVAIAGGAESLLSRLVFCGFARTEAMTRAPARPRGPFDAGRDGFVMGEGAGFLVLADPDVSARAGIAPKGRILGFGETTDAHHLVAPDPCGTYAAACMRAALASADLRPEDIGHVNAHATGTALGDAAEAAALDAVFGPCGVPVTANKGTLGHLIGAAGVVEAMGGLLATRRGLIPPTAGVEEPDDDLKVDLVYGAPRPIAPGLPVLSNSFAFGGHNVSLILA